MSEENNQDDTGSPEASYYFSEGVAGQGDAPEWFKSDKYKTVADQAKAYVDLESMHGKKMEQYKNFSGAPDAYEVTLPEGLQINAEDPMFSTAQEWAKGLNLNQEGFNSLVNMYAEIETAKEAALDQQYQETIAQIDNFEARAKSINDFLGANGMESLSGLITSKDQLEQFEALLNKAGNPSLDPDSDASGMPTDEEIDKLMFEKDDNGRQIYSYDKDRQERVRKMLERKVGKGTFTQVVG